MPEDKSTVSSSDPKSPYTWARNVVNSIPSPKEGPSILGALRQIGNSAINMVERTDLALQGKDVDLSPEATFGDIFEMATLGGGVAMSTMPTNAVGTFGGTLGRFTKQRIKQYQKAVDLEAKLRKGLEDDKQDPNQFNRQIQQRIFQETGWFKNENDNLWRFHIDDTKAKWKEINADTFAGKTDFKISDMLNHKELFDVYPWLKDIKLIHNQPEGHGMFHQGNIYLSWTDGFKNPNVYRKVMLHEIQHAIQQQEGFKGRGASPDFVLKNLITRLESIHKELALAPSVPKPNLTARQKLQLQEVNALHRFLADKSIRPRGEESPEILNQLARKLYFADPGEAEARMVEHIFQRRRVNPTNLSHGIPEGGGIPVNVSAPRNPQAPGGFRTRDPSPRDKEIELLGNF